MNVLKEIPNSSNSENNTLDLIVFGTVRNYMKYTVRQYKILQSSIVCTFPLSLRKASQRISPSNPLNSLKFALLKFRGLTSLFAGPVTLTISNYTSAWSLQPRIPPILTL